VAEQEPEYNQQQDQTYPATTVIAVWAAHSPTAHAENKQEYYQNYQHSFLLSALQEKTDHQAYNVAAEIKQRRSPLIHRFVFLVINEFFYRSRRHCNQQHNR
jgi:hypothetical protein